jgi:hypothetical protein
MGDVPWEERYQVLERRYHQIDAECRRLQIALTAAQTKVARANELALEHRRYSAQVWAERDQMHTLWLEAEAKIKELRAALDTADAGERDS